MGDFLIWADLCGRSTCAAQSTALTVTWARTLFLQLLFDFLERSPARSPALDAAVATAVVAIAVVFFVGAVLVHLYVLAVQAAAAQPSRPPPTPWRFVALGVMLVFVLLVVIRVFLCDRFI
jgi:hypothetical protein